MDSLNGEATAVMRVARGLVTGSAEGSGIRDNSSSEELDWDVVANYASKTRLMSAMSRAVSLSDEVPQWLWESWLASRHFSRASQIQLDSTLRQIAIEFERTGIQAVVRKGPHCSSLYQSVDSRPYGDIDLLIDLESSKGVSEALTRLGFGRGLLDATGKSVEFGQEAAAFFQLGAGALPTFVKDSSPDAPLPVVVVDAAWDWLPPRVKVGTQIPAARALETSLRIDGLPLPVLGPAYALLDWCCNLYLSSVSLYYLSKHKFRRLCPYVDILLLTRDPSFQSEEVWDLLDRPSAQQPVAFVLANVERAFPGLLPASLSDWSRQVVHKYDINLDAIGQLDATSVTFPAFPNRFFESDLPPTPAPRVKF